MRKSILLIAIAAFVLSVAGQARSQSGSGVEDLLKPMGHEPPMMGLHWARGLDPNFMAAKAGHLHQRQTPNMSRHSGTIMPFA